MRVAIFFFVAIAACTKHEPEPAVPPDQATGKYFSAVAAADCDAILALSGGELHRKIVDNGCDAAFGEAKSHGLVFVGASNVRPDGRDPNARLVDVAIKTDGKDKKIIARLSLESGVWKVATL